MPTSTPPATTAPPSAETQIASSAAHSAYPPPPCKNAAPASTNPLPPSPSSAPAASRASYDTRTALSATPTNHSSPRPTPSSPPLSEHGQCYRASSVFKANGGTHEEPVNGIGSVAVEVCGEENKLNDLSDIYKMTQCTRGISSSDCFTCLEPARGSIGNEIGGRIYSRSCSQGSRFTPANLPSSSSRLLNLPVLLPLIMLLLHHHHHLSLNKVCWVF